MFRRWQFGITTLYHFIFVPLDDRLASGGGDADAGSDGTTPAWYR